MASYPCPECGALLVVDRDILEPMAKQDEHLICASCNASSPASWWLGLPSEEEMLAEEEISEEEMPEEEMPAQFEPVSFEQPIIEASEDDVNNFVGEDEIDLPEEEIPNPQPGAVRPAEPEEEKEVETEPQE